MNQPGVLFIVSAPSGAGKTSLVNAVLASLKSAYAIDRVITYTSRPPRLGEIDGVDYHYISEAQFQRLIPEGFFLNWSTVYGAYYGTPRTVLDDLAKGLHCILIPDRDGAQKIIHNFKAYIYKVITIWIEAPSLEVLEERLRNRAQNTPEQIARRLILAAQEMKDEAIYPFYTHKIVNEKFEIAFKKLENVIKNEIILKEKIQNKSAEEHTENKL